MSTGPMTTVGARLEIDWTRCDGHGLCAQLLPQRIGLDEWGYPVLTDAPLGPADRAELKAVRRTVAACPALALRLDPPTATREHR